jgi:hypothetical protein
MSILDKALEIAIKQKEEEQRFLEQRKIAYAKMQEELSAMKSLVIDELKKIDGQHGFKVQFIENEDWTFNVFAYLTKFAGEHTCESKVAWFKAKVVNGIYDASDDCRNIEYTEPCVWMRIYPPRKFDYYGIDASWDIQELKMYNNGGGEFSFSSLEDAQKFFANFAGQLSLWMV